MLVPLDPPQSIRLADSFPSTASWAAVMAFLARSEGVVGRATTSEIDDFRNISSEPAAHGKECHQSSKTREEGRKAEVGGVEEQSGGQAGASREQ